MSDHDIEKALSEVEGNAITNARQTSSGPFGAFRFARNSQQRASSVSSTSDYNASGLDVTFQDSKATPQPSPTALPTPSVSGPNESDLADDLARLDTDISVDPVPNDVHTSLASVFPSPQYNGGKFDGHGILTSRVKCLLHNYAVNVVPIYCIISTSDNPWKSFILPRVLQCCAELDIIGASPAPRRALLYAVLTISAYNLQNMSKDRDNPLSSLWGAEASEYKGMALELLESCIDSTEFTLIRSDHDEVLAAMLSMFTIDVSSLDDGSALILTFDRSSRAI